MNLAGDIHRKMIAKAAIRFWQPARKQSAPCQLFEADYNKAPVIVVAGLVF
jgi:hypothetical protein